MPDVALRSDTPQQVMHHLEAHTQMMDGPEVQADACTRQYCYFILENIHAGLCYLTNLICIGVCHRYEERLRYTTRQLQSLRANAEAQMNHASNVKVLREHLRTDIQDGQPSMNNFVLH